MNLTEHMAVVKARIESELKMWENGEKQWSVSNQFDESVLESALSNLNEDKFKTVIDKFHPRALDTLSVMDWAFALSEFKPPELDSGWVD